MESNYEGGAFELLRKDVHGLAAAVRQLGDKIGTLSLQICTLMIPTTFNPLQRVTACSSIVVS